MYSHTAKTNDESVCKLFDKMTRLPHKKNLNFKKKVSTPKEREREREREMWTKQKLAMVSFFACAVLLALAFTSFSVSFEVTMRGPFALSERESSFTYRKNNNTNNNNHGASLTLEKNETSCDCGGRQSNSSTTERKENQPPVVERANTLSSYDLIVAVYDENPTEYLKHLEDCCPARE